MIEKQDHTESTIEKLLIRDELMTQIERVYGFTSVTSWQITLLDPGRKFKSSWLLTINDGKKQKKLVVKFYKKNNPKRFQRELEPRDLEGIKPFSPALLFSTQKIHFTGKNRPFEHGDYMLFIEEYIEGDELLTLRETPDAAIYTERAETNYRLLGTLMADKLGRVLTNPNPRNVIITPEQQPIIVDWGGQKEMDPKIYAAMIDRNLLAPMLG